MKKYLAIGLFVLALFLPHRVYGDVSLSGDVQVSAGASTDAPTTADYIVGTANGSLSAEQSLGTLTTGLLKNTVAGGTGTLSTATAGTDYVVPGVTALNNLTGVSTGLTGMLKASSGTISAASAGTDYIATESDPNAILTNGTRGLSGNWYSGAYNIGTLGNVGIGNTNPQGLLHAGTKPGQGLLFISSAGNVGIGTTSPEGVLHAGTAASSGLIVQRSGNVGIGTTDPSQKLEVNGTILGALPLIDVALSNDGANSFSGLMVAAVPSTGKVYVKSFEEEVKGNLNVLASWSSWTDFDTPDATSKITGVSVTLSNDGTLDTFSGLIIVRMSSGNVYLRSFEGQLKGVLDVPNNWGSWTDFGDPGL